MPLTLEELKEKAVESGIEVEDDMSEEDIEALLKENGNLDTDGNEDDDEEEPSVEDLLKKVKYLEKEAKKAFGARDRAKAAEKKLKKELEDIKDQLVDAPDKDELNRLSEELQTLKEKEAERQEKIEEEEFKKLSELEREKRRFNKELDKIKESFEDKVNEALSLSKKKEEELNEKESLIQELTKKTLSGEIARIAGENNALKPFQIVRLLKDEFTFNDTIGEFIFEKKNDKGQIIDDMTIEERVKEFLEDPENENLIKPKGSTSGLETRQSIETKTSSSKQGKRYGYDPKDPDLIKEADEKGLDVDFLIDTKIMMDKKLKKGAFAPKQE